MPAEGFYREDGEGVCGGGLSSKPRKITFAEFCSELSETLDDLCAQMLAIGMPYELYWYGEPRAVNYYLRAQKYKQMIDNRNCHLQGVYVLKALQEVLQFSANPVEIYPREPLNLGGEETNSVEKEVADMKAAFARIKAERS